MNKIVLSVKYAELIFLACTKPETVSDYSNYFGIIWLYEYERKWDLKINHNNLS